MDDINRFEGDNMGGLIRFDFALAKDIESIEEPVDSVICGAVIMKPGTRWYCGYATRGTIGYTEPTEDTSAGPVYKKSFSAFCPKDDQEKTSLFARMRNELFVIKFLDSNLQCKIAGSLTEPLSFKYVLNTKTNMSDLAGYAINFYGDGTHEAYLYDG